MNSSNIKMYRCTNCRNPSAALRKCSGCAKARYVFACGYPSTLTDFNCQISTATGTARKPTGGSTKDVQNRSGLKRFVWYASFALTPCFRPPPNDFADVGAVLPPLGMSAAFCHMSVKTCPCDRSALVWTALAPCRKRPKGCSSSKHRLRSVHTGRFRLIFEKKMARTCSFPGSTGLVTQTVHRHLVPGFKHL